MELHCSYPIDFHMDIGLESSYQFLEVEIVSSNDSGEDTSNAKYFRGSVDIPVVLRANTFRVSSTILALKSQFFSKLFSNGAEVPDQEHVTIQIKESDEAAFVELLNFMSRDALCSTTAPKLLDITMIAIKFEVDSCIHYCIVSLSKITMTTELALLFLKNLPQISSVELVQPLIEAAKLFLRSLYKDIDMYEEELMDLPLSGIEAILSADDLHVTSEDEVFDFVLKWATANYPKLEERRKVICYRLFKYIRFPYMSSSRLVEVPKCNDLDKRIAFASVHNALLSKVDALSAKASFLQKFALIQMD